LDDFPAVPDMIINSAVIFKPGEGIVCISDVMALVKMRYRVIRMCVGENRLKAGGGHGSFFTILILRSACHPGFGNGSEAFDRQKGMMILLRQS